MAVPKKKTSKRRTGMRYNAKKTEGILLTTCQKCGEHKLPHIACEFCGYYGDKKVLDVETKLDKKLKKESKQQEAGDKE